MRGRARFCYGRCCGHCDDAWLRAALVAIISPGPEFIGKGLKPKNLLIGDASSRLFLQFDWFSMRGRKGSRPQMRRLIMARISTVPTGKTPATLIIALTIAVSLALLGSMAFAAQNRFTLKAPNGVAFSDFKGYETWQDVAVSQVDGGLKVIVGNTAMINAYRKGIPGNGQHFPDGSKIVKIEWSQKKNPESPYSVTVPDTLKSVSLIEKDSKRFPETSGWGYAQFLYDPATRTFKAYGSDASFAKQVCYSCHTAVAGKDYIFTAYPPR